MNKANFQSACVIDDDFVFTVGIKKLIEMHDFCQSLVFFKNGQEAIDHFTRAIEQNLKLPEVILLDLNMPVLDGWQFLSQFQIIGAQIKNKPIIYVVSSSIDSHEMERAQEHPLVTGYFTKPISRTDLDKMCLSD